MKGLLQHKPIIATLFDHLSVISMMSLKRAYPLHKKNFPNIYTIFEKRFNKLLAKYYGIDAHEMRSLMEDYSVEILNDGVSSVLFDEPFNGNIFMLTRSSYAFYHSNVWDNMFIDKYKGYKLYSPEVFRLVERRLQTKNFRTYIFPHSENMIITLTRVVGSHFSKYIFSSRQLSVYRPRKCFKKQKSKLFVYAWTKSVVVFGIIFVLVILLFLKKGLGF